MRNRLFIAFFTTLYFSLNLFATTSEELAKKLIKAYPDFLEKYENNYIYFKNGDKIIFSSPKNYTNYEDKLNNASLEDQMSIPYKKIENNDNFIPSVNDDAGRFRNQDFFKKMYGNSQKEIEKNLVKIKWLPKTENKTLFVTKINDVNKKLESISIELDNLPSE